MFKLLTSIEAKGPPKNVKASSANGLKGTTTLSPALGVIANFYTDELPCRNVRDF